MPKAEKKMTQEKFSWQIYAIITAAIGLVVALIIKLFLFPSVTPSIPRTPGSSTTSQCPEGTSHFQNTAYSICYPKGWIVSKNPDITYPDGSISQQISSFTNPADSSDYIQVIPNRGMLVGPSACLLQEQTNINTYAVERLTYRDSTSPGKCGVIVSYTSIFQTAATQSSYKKGIVLSYVTGKGVTLSSEQYLAMEESFKIINR